MTPIGAFHEVAIDRLTEWSFHCLPQGRAWVRVQNSVGLAELASAPEPDLAWVERKDYSRQRPEGPDILLVVEVSESSLAYDCGEKADLYAAAGVRDYWVANLVDRVIEVRRAPLNGRYRSLQTFSGDQEVRPILVPDAMLRPARLFAPPA